MLEYLPIAFTVIGTLSLLVGGYCVVKYGWIVWRIKGRFRLGARPESPMAAHSIPRLHLDPSISRSTAALVLVPIVFVGFVLWTYIEESVELRSEASSLTANLEILQNENLSLTATLVQHVAQLRDRERDIERLSARSVPASEREKALLQQAKKLKVVVVEIEMAYAAISEVAADRERTLTLQLARLNGLKQQVEDLQNTVAAQEEKLQAPPKAVLARLSKKVPKFDLSVAYGSFGAFVHERGDPGRAKEYYSALRSLAMEQQYKAGEATAYENIAIVSELSGDREQAESAYEQAVGLSRKLGKPKERPLTGYDNLGIVGLVRNDLISAQKFHAAAFGLADKQQYDWGRASAKMNLGVIAYMRNDFAKAEALYSEALNFFGDGRYNVGMAMVYTNLAVLSEAQNKPDAAKKNRTRATEMLMELDQ